MAEMKSLVNPNGNLQLWPEPPSTKYVWLKLMCGVSLSDEQLESQSPHPAWELGAHVTMKFVEGLGLLGTVLFGPAVACARTETRNWPGIKNMMMRGGRAGVFSGLTFGPIFCYIWIRNERRNAIWDRVYRLRYNKGQIRADQESIFGAVVGAGIGAATKNGAVFGSVVGMSVGLVGAGIYTNMIENKK